MRVVSDVDGYIMPYIAHEFDHYFKAPLFFEGWVPLVKLLHCIVFFSISFPDDEPLTLRDKTLRGLKSLYVANRRGAEEIRKLASAQKEEEGEEEEMNMSESDIAAKKQEILVLYLKDSYNFTLLLQVCVASGVASGIPS